MSVLRATLKQMLAPSSKAGPTVISTFSGAGGSSLGLSWAGCQVLWASEFISEAAAVYRDNLPTPHVDTRDLRDVSAATILRQTGLVRGELDIIEGSPPCSSFSMAGKRERGWGKRRRYSTRHAQRTDDLFGVYLRLVDSLRPKVVLAENVPGMTMGRARGYFTGVLRELITKMCAGTVFGFNST